MQNNSKFMNWTRQKLMPAFRKNVGNKYMVVLRDGMIISVQFTIFGSIFMIANRLKAGLTLKYH